MKNIYIIIIFSAFIALACNDEFMEKFPEDKISDNNFWKTAADIELYANQFYRTLYDARLAWYNIDNYSDNQSPASRNAYTWGEYTLPSSGGGWGKSDWLQIRRCNYALDRIAEMESSADVLQYEAEIRFFKAFHYFVKLKKFGEVPWIEKTLNIDSEDLKKARDSREVVVDNIIAELDFGIANLPETSSTDRVTKYAAYALKSDVCLYEGTFRKYHAKGSYETLLRDAISACEAIMTSGLFDIWTTGDPNEDYFQLFVQYELKGNPEAIMAQRYITNKRMHNNIRQLGEQKTGYNQAFVESYLCTDGLPISLSPLYQGNAVYGDEFMNRDPRMQQSIYSEARYYRIYDDGTMNKKPMPEFENSYCNTSYYVLKGYSPYERDRLPSICTTDDFLGTFRYAYTCLNYAEAKAELGECTQADLDMSINKLRDRVAMPHLTVAVGFTDPDWPNWEVPVTPLINEIRRERRLETCAEGQRWDDLVRWKAGKLLEDVRTTRGATDPATAEPRILYPGFTTRTWDDKLYLYPIPTQELSLNTNLVQNPGW